MKFKGIFGRLIWGCQKRKLKNVGNNSSVGRIISLVNPQYIEIGDGFRAGRNIKLQVWTEFNKIRLQSEHRLRIGNNVAIMDGCQISCAGTITIGDGTLLGDNVFITDNYHGRVELDKLDIPPHMRNLYVKGSVQIGRNVWLGRNVCVMPGVVIGDGTIIGANAVVTKDIPNKAVAVGVPAKVIKTIS